jgi:hypothetical protein
MLCGHGYEQVWSARTCVVLPDLNRGASGSRAYHRSHIEQHINTTGMTLDGDRRRLTF